MDVLLLALAQILVGILLAPLLFGVTRTTKARLQWRRGPSILQPYRDLAKWFAKDPIESEVASPLTAAVPVVVLGTMLVTVLLVPLVARTPALPGPADILVVVGLLALVRFALALGALDAGGAFGGMGASREVAIASLVEPGLLVALAVGIAAAGTTDLAHIAHSGDLLGGAGVTPALALGAAAFAIVAVAETGHEPVDNPDTHLELTMIHEGMVLEYSGPYLALILWARDLKQLIMLTLLADLVLPLGIGAAAYIAIPALLAKTLLFGLLLAFIETGLAKVRILKIPDLLLSGAALALLAVLADLRLGG